MGQDGWFGTTGKVGKQGLRGPDASIFLEADVLACRACKLASSFQQRKLAGLYW
jgi:hypothetical protein